MLSSIDTWKFLAGLGLFLYGINLMEQVTGKIAGRSFKLFLKKYTSSLPRSILGGTIVTGLIQSSSVVILMLMSFVGAGVISFRNALGLLIGSNLGTTVDSWFIATVGFTFNLQAYSLPLIAVTAISMFFTRRREKLYGLLNFIFSIGILLLGFGFMKDGAEQLVANFNIAAYAGHNLGFIVVLGFILTVIIQSSSATVAIALTAIHAHALSLPAAACLIIGSELGTTIKILFSSMSSNIESKMLAWGDFLFNIFTVIISFSFLHWIIVFIRDIAGIKDPMIGLVFFQSFINLLAILLFLPFIKVFANMLEKFFRRSKKQEDKQFGKDLPPMADLAAIMMQKASMDIFLRSLDFHKRIIGDPSKGPGNGLYSQLRSFTRIHGTTDRLYTEIKEAEGDILKYYAGLQKDELSRDDYEKVNRFISSARQSVHAAKSVHDIRNDLKGFLSTANNFLYDQYGLLQEEWLEFANELQTLPGIKDSKYAGSEIHKLMIASARQFRAHAKSIASPHASRELNAFESSTLLNVYNELWSSKKALLRAAAFLMAADKEEELLTHESLQL